MSHPDRDLFLSMLQDALGELHYEPPVAGYDGSMEDWMIHLIQELVNSESAAHACLRNCEEARAGFEDRLLELLEPVMVNRIIIDADQCSGEEIIEMAVARLVVEAVLGTPASVSPAEVSAINRRFDELDAELSGGGDE